MFRIRFLALATIAALSACSTDVSFEEAGERASHKCYSCRGNR